MIRFPQRLLLDTLAPDHPAVQETEKAQYQLTGDFVYWSAKYGQIVVPTGLITDFASIPKILWNIIDPDDPRICFPSVVHDYLYSRKGDLGLGSRMTFNRQQADEVLQEGMQVCGAGKALALSVYYAVRIGGSSHWS